MSTRARPNFGAEVFESQCELVSWTSVRSCLNLYFVVKHANSISMLNPLV